jgi:hypothetical protein
MTARYGNIPEPFLGNSSVNMFPWQWICMQRRGTVGNRVLYGGPCQGVIRKKIGTTKSVLYGSVKKRVNDSELSCQLKIKL